LLKKLEKIGIKNTELLWFKNYLTNRSQYVAINDKKSILCTVKFGVPQGSILVPLLFLLYINDLPFCSKFLAFLFADDTTLLLSNPDIHLLMLEAIREFYKIVTFFRQHNLALHPDKTKFMIFSNSAPVRSLHLDLFMNLNNPDCNDQNLIFRIEQISQHSKIPAVRFLGVFFDTQLNFDYHIKLITSKLS
jgi:Reverse transcriptase (RNA-dependent DNA polymerase)